MAKCYPCVHITQTVIDCKVISASVDIYQVVRLDIFEVIAVPGDREVGPITGKLGLLK